MNLKNSPTLKSYRINPALPKEDRLDKIRKGGVKVGITMGDPSGIGPYITSKAIQQIKDAADFVIIGDKWVFDKWQSSKSKEQRVGFIDLNNVNHKNFSFGKIRAEYGRASIEYLDKALELIRAKQIDCLVTCPVSKEAWNLAGFKHSGHTEYLARRTHTKNFVMMLLNKHLKISLATRHIPLRRVSSELQPAQLYKAILITYQSLKKLFLLKEPRMVVCGLNPHASDNGLIGYEENQVIKPVLKRLKQSIKYIDGPISSDVAILKAKQKLYDGLLAMYHDQALIPLKLLDNRRGVNLTLGLPFIRTSPLHGTAFDIAKDKSADPASLIEAIKLAIKCALNLKKA